MRACTAPECLKPQYARGYCSMHYTRVIRHGALDYPIADPKERFLAKVEISSTSGCWIWTGSLDNHGYGRLALGLKSEGQRPVAAHRLAHEWWVAPIPDGYEVDHLCRVRHCVNPEHLEAVTHAENVRRAWEARTSA